MSRADGSQWKKEAWLDHVREAQVAAELPETIVAYSLRHSVITDLLTGGMDIFHVAKVAGTSVAMIEQNYGHVQGEHVREHLAKLAL